MKNKIILIAILSFSTFSFSQDNTLPTTGNVGIGTLNPSSKLDVNGSMIVDSTLLIKDSLRVNKDIRTMGKLFVEDKVVMKMIILPYSWHVKKTHHGCQLQQTLQL